MQVLPLRALASGFLLITVAGEDREAGILGEARIADGEVTEDEDGAVSRFDVAGMKAIGAQAIVAISGIGNFDRSH